MTTTPGTPSTVPGPAGAPARRRSRKRVWSPEEIDALGATTDLLTAASILGIGRTTAYTLVAAGEFPVPVVRVGARRYRVAVARLRALLGIDTTS